VPDYSRVTIEFKHTAIAVFPSYPRRMLRSLMVYLLISRVTSISQSLIVYLLMSRATTDTWPTDGKLSCSAEKSVSC
jgi:hypothetical protein